MHALLAQLLYEYNACKVESLASKTTNLAFASSEEPTGRTERHAVLLEHKPMGHMSLVNCET